MILQIYLSLNMRIICYVYTIIYTYIKSTNVDNNTDITNPTFNTADDKLNYLTKITINIEYKLDTINSEITSFYKSPNYNHTLYSVKHLLNQ